MKIKVVKHYSYNDFAKTGNVNCIDVYIGKAIIAEFYEHPEQKYEGFYEALKYTHGKKLEVIEESIND